MAQSVITGDDFMTDEPSSDLNLEKEIAAISQVYAALRELDNSSRQRVLNYVSNALGIQSPRTEDRVVSADTPRTLPAVEEAETADSENEDGINAVAQRWIKRSGLAIDGLSSIFSVGGDDIDLITETVPGDTKKERMHSVFLLKAMASYLASGAARTSHDSAKEACMHYDAYDPANFSAYLKSFASEIGGDKKAGYTLNARGLTAATNLIKTMIKQQNGGQA
jgi:hypothetical protein